MKNILLLIVLSVQSLTVVTGQGWFRYYGPPSAGKVADVHTLPNGGYEFSLIYDGFVTTDEYGNVSSERYFAVSDKGDHFFHTPSNDFVVVNYKNIYPPNKFCTVTWVDGNDQAYKILFIGEAQQDARVAAQSDGILIANFDSLNSFNVFKLDWSGDTLWSKTHNLPHDVFFDMVSTRDGGSCLLSRSSTNTSMPLLIRMDSLGNILWANTYVGGGFTIKAADLIENKKEEFVVEYGLNVAESPGTFLFVRKDGTFRLNKTVGQTTYYNFCETTDDNYVMVGLNSSFSFSSFKCVKFDSLGNVLLEKNIQLRPASTHLPYVVTATSNGGWIVGGGIVERGPFLVKCDALGNIYPAQLKGDAIFDLSHDCVSSPAEPRLQNWIVTAERITDGVLTYASTDSLGHYEIDIDTGAYSVRINPIGDLWAPCQEEILTGNVGFGDTAVANFPVRDSMLCSLLDVSIATPFLRRCFDNEYTVSWCNMGTFPAYDAKIKVILPPAISYVSATLPLASQSGDTLLFNIGFVGYGKCGSLKLKVNVSCETSLGQTLCAKALIYPDTLCRTYPNWSGAQITASAECIGDSIILLALNNIGTAATSPGLEYIITEDLVVLRQDTFDLAPGEHLDIEWNADGSTVRIEAEQEPFFPFNSNPSAAVEGCGLSGLFNFGFVNQYTLDDSSPFVDIDCHEVVASFDPNDKQGFPMGYGEQHFIQPGTDLTYLIRFQNTGTDTAFTVELRDTLSPWLNPASVIPGASSHPYSWTLTEQGILSFRFDHILLPDSNVNEAASHGFIQFRISQQAAVPLGTEVFNRAGIYFDYNEVVLTNSTLHTIQEHFLQVFVSTANTPENRLRVQVMPNPFSGSALFVLPEGQENGASLRLFNHQGQLIRQEAFEASELRLDGQNLANGIYWFEIQKENGSVIGTGKIINLK